jgi:hypothetical protein
VTAATAPIAYTVHDGRGVPATWRRDLIAEWLTANGINPDHVHADDPIRVLTVPYRPPETADDGAWLIQVIVLTELYTGPDGTREVNLITGKPVACQRTVPLRVPFPTDPMASSTQEGATA